MKMNKERLKEKLAGLSKKEIQEMELTERLVVDIQKMFHGQRKDIGLKVLIHCMIAVVDSMSESSMEAMALSAKVSQTFISGVEIYQSLGDDDEDTTLQ